MVETTMVSAALEHDDEKKEYFETPEELKAKVA